MVAIVRKAIVRKTCPCGCTSSSSPFAPAWLPLLICACVLPVSRVRLACTAGDAQGIARWALLAAWCVSSACPRAVRFDARVLSDVWCILSAARGGMRGGSNRGGWPHRPSMPTAGTP